MDGRTLFRSQTSVESVLSITLELLEQLSFTEEKINTFSTGIPIMIRYDHQGGGGGGGKRQRI